MDLKEPDYERVRNMTDEEKKHMKIAIGFSQAKLFDKKRKEEEAKESESEEEIPEVIIETA